MADEGGSKQSWASLSYRNHCSGPTSGFALDTQNWGSRRPQVQKNGVLGKFLGVLSLTISNQIISKAFSGFYETSKPKT